MIAAAVAAAAAAEGAAAAARLLGPAAPASALRPARPVAAGALLEHVAALVASLQPESEEGGGEADDAGFDAHLSALLSLLSRAAGAGADGAAAALGAGAPQAAYVALLQTAARSAQQPALQLLAALCRTPSGRRAVLGPWSPPAGLLTCPSSPGRVQHLSAQLRALREAVVHGRRSRIIEARDLGAARVLSGLLACEPPGDKQQAAALLAALSDPGGSFLLDAAACISADLSDSSDGAGQCAEGGGGLAVVRVGDADPRVSLRGQRGLEATRPWPAGHLLAPYVAWVCSQEEMDACVPLGCRAAFGRYSLATTAQGCGPGGAADHLPLVFCAHPPALAGPASCVNDALGAADPLPNCALVEVVLAVPNRDGRGGGRSCGWPWVFVVSLRPIAAGEEVVARYGPAAWQTLRAREAAHRSIAAVVGPGRGVLGHVHAHGDED